MKRDQGAKRLREVEVGEMPPKVVCLWVFIEWRRPGASSIEWELLGCLRLMVIMGALKTTSVINAM